MQLHPGAVFLAFGAASLLMAPQKQDPCLGPNPPPYCGTAIPTPTRAATATPTRPPGTPTPIPTTPPGAASWDLVVPISAGWFTSGPDGYLWIAGQNRPFEVLLKKPDGTCLRARLAVGVPPTPTPNIIASR